MESMDITVNCPRETSEKSPMSLNDDEEDKTIDERVTMENVLEKLGVTGKYQLIQILALTLCVTPYTFAYFSFIFIGYETPSTCFTTNETKMLNRHNLTHLHEPVVTYQSCGITVTSNGTGNGTIDAIFQLPCEEGHLYEEYKYASVVSAWDLVCGNGGILAFVQSSFVLGSAIGPATALSLADRYGRYYAYAFCSVVVVITELAILFSNNIYMIITSKFFTGLCIGVMYVIRNVVSLELLTSRYRQIYGAFSCIIWSVNVMTVAGVAYFLKYSEWKYLQIVTILTGVPAFLVVFILNESPTWLVASKRYKKAEKVVLKACKMNSKPFQEVRHALVQCIRYTKSSQEERKEGFDGKKSIRKKEGSFLKAIQNRGFLIRVSKLYLVWFASSLIYIGLYYTSSTLAGDRHLNFILVAVLDIPSAFTIMIMLVYLGRRTVILIFSLMCVLCFLTSTCIIALDTGTSHASYAVTAFSLLGKFAIGCSFNVLPSYSPELFPTTIRSTGSGLCLAATCLGAMLGPFLSPLFKMVNWGPGFVITLLSFICFCLVWTLPETKGRELPSSVKETMDWK